jgi:integrase
MAARWLILLKQKIGWHTFRHTYSTLLIANGENVKVVQELMRHASSRFTLETYSQACLIAKREAQRRLVEAIPNEPRNRHQPFQCSSVSLNFK